MFNDVINYIPETLTQYRNYDAKWVRLYSLIENKCLFIIGDESIQIDGHSHSMQIETVKVIEGYCEIITYNGDVVLHKVSEGESFVIDTQLKHKCIFKRKSILEISWKPIIEDVNLEDIKSAANKFLNESKVKNEVFHMAGGAIIEADINTNTFIDVDEEFASWFGKSRNEMVGVCYKELIQNLSDEELEDINENVKNDGDLGGVTKTIYLFEGNYYELSWVGINYDELSSHYVAGVFLLNKWSANDYTKLRA